VMVVERQMRAAVCTPSGCRTKLQPSMKLQEGNSRGGNGYAADQRLFVEMTYSVQQQHIHPAAAASNKQAASPHLSNILRASTSTASPNSTSKLELATPPDGIDASGLLPSELLGGRLSLPCCYCWCSRRLPDQQNVPAMIAVMHTAPAAQQIGYPADPAR
jgi:hypothetical protein